jgi:hypothetical protein
VHNRVRQALFQLLKRYASTDWSLVEETLLSKSQLRLKTMATALVQQAGRTVKDSAIQLEPEQMDLSRWQPEIIGISFAKHKIAIGPEYTILPDFRPLALLEAHSRKIKSYIPVLAAQCTNSEWTVWVLPWVVGARGMVRHDELAITLKFLKISKQKCTGIIQHSVRTSVEGPKYMHQI